MVKQDNNKSEVKVNKYIDEKKLKPSILIPILVLLVLVLSVSSYIIYTMQQQNINKQIMQHISGIDVLFDDLLEKEAKIIENQLTIIKNDGALVQFWQDNDYEAIKDHINPYFIEINDIYAIKELSLINYDKIELFNTNNYSLILSDTIKGNLIDSVDFYRKTFFGLELTKQGKINIKVISPWKYNNKFLGYISASIDVTKILPKFKNILNSEVVLIVKSSLLSDDEIDPDNNMIYEKDWEYYVYDHTLIFDNLSFFKKLSQINPRITSNLFNISEQKIDFIGGFVNLKLFNRQKIGNIVVLNYISDQKAELNKLLTILIVFSIFLFILLFVFFYIYVGKIQSSIYDSALALRSSELKFRKLFEDSIDPFFILDKRKIIDCNAAALKMLQYESKDFIISKTLSDFSPEKQPDGRFSQEKGFKQTQKAYTEGYNRFEWLHKNSLEEEFYVDVTLTAIQNNIKKEPILYAIWRDINKQKEHEQELIKTRDKAEKANIEKTNFLINMNHELTTPLNAIIGLNRLMLKMPLDKKQEEYSKMIRTSANLIHSVIKDIHDIRRIEIEKIEIRNTTFNLKTLLLSIMDAYEFKARQIDIGFNYNMQREIIPYLVGDPVRLRQIIIILLSNAIKYTTKGDIGLSVIEIEKSNEITKLQFTVEDTGIGIPQNKLNSLFTAPQNETQFTGKRFGLVTVKKIIDLMNGEITVESTEKIGSKFCFTLEFNNLNKDEKEDFIAIEKSVKIESNTKPLKILVAEDNLINQKYIQVVLNSYGHSIEIAIDGSDAVAKSKITKFDCILMDIEMPVKNGVEATQEIRNDNRNHNQNTIIVAITANTMAGDKERYLNAGMNYYIPKPVNEHILYNVLNKITK